MAERNLPTPKGTPPLATVARMTKRQDRELDQLRADLNEAGAELTRLYALLRTLVAAVIEDQTAVRNDILKPVRVQIDDFLLHSPFRNKA